MRFLVVGTSRQGHDQLLKAGHEVVVFITRKAALAADLGKDFSQIYYYDEAVAAEHLVDIAKVLHQDKPFDGVYAFHDNTQLLARQISLGLELAFPIAERLIELAQDKHALRRHLQLHGLNNVQSGLAESLAQAVEVAEQLGFPVIIKPTNGTGSSGVSKVENADGVAPALEWLRHCGNEFPVLIEQFVTGREFSVESFSEKGEHRVMSITEKFIDPETFVEKGHLMPARLEPLQWQKIEGYVVDVLTAMDFQNGPSHTEIILSERDDTPCLVETHTRPGGDRITDLLINSTGYDVFEMTARQLTGEAVLPTLPEQIDVKAHSAIWFATPSFAEPVILGKTFNFEQVNDLAHVSELRVLKAPGDTLKKVTNSFDRLAMAVVISESSELALEQAQQAVADLSFELSFKAEQH